MRKNIIRICMILTMLVATIYLINGQASAKTSSTYKTTEVNQIAHIKSKTSKIYKKPNDKKKFILANTTYTGRAFYD